jgi:hypothetical protein
MQARFLLRRAKQCQWIARHAATTTLAKEFDSLAQDYEAAAAGEETGRLLRRYVAAPALSRRFGPVSADE